MTSNSLSLIPKPGIENNKSNVQTPLKTPHIEVSEGGSMMLGVSRPKSKLTRQSPPPTTQRTVLEEDEYFSMLQEIVTRDYFSQAEDIKKNVNEFDREKDIKYGQSISSSESHFIGLNDFQQRYTSEDNDSFKYLIEAEQARKREKYPWFYEGHHVDSHKAKTMKQLEDNEKQKLLTDTSYSEDVENARKLGWTDERNSLLDSWKSNPRNSLMFPPPAPPSISSPDVVADVTKTTVIPTNTKLHEEVKHAEPESDNDEQVNRRC